MNKKLHYSAPAVELTEISVERNFLFSEGSGTAGASSMKSGSWGSWDE